VMNTLWSKVERCMAKVESVWKRRVQEREVRGGEGNING